MLSVRHLLPASVAMLLLWTAPAQSQEHSYAPSDIDNGRGLYQANCLGCHGNDGAAVEGADLASGRFRRAVTDEELIALIRTGIPNTLMIPRPQLSYAELRAIVAFLRTMRTIGMQDDSSSAVTVGDAARGEQLFYGKGDCASCHGIGGGGSRLYPDLAGIGAQRSPAALQEVLLEPRASVREGQRFYRVETGSGEVVEGLLLNRDTHSVQLLDGDERLRSFTQEQLAGGSFIATPMPAYLDVLSADEIADLVAYLLTL